ncbi:hypothetical protein ACIQPQ_34750 [Streptomyces sp. NPDC091281]|uniref:hypothetical protein n=1 Tax=Streptomyces sp. NPDC091281 TaxID=3365985 RepID=UPI0038142D0A
MEIRFSGSRWRQIEKGYRGDSGTEVVAPDPTLAHMAWTLGITSDRLAETGREKAVAILRELERARAASPPPEAAPLTDLDEWQQQIILNALDNEPRSAKEKALLLRTLAAKIEAAEEEATPRDTPGRSAS